MTSPVRSPVENAGTRLERTRASHVRWVVFGFLCVLSFLTYYDRQCMTRAQGAIGKSLSLTDENLGWALATCASAAVVSADVRMLRERGVHPGE